MGLFDGGTYAKPGLWDMSGDAKQKKLEGVASIRPQIGQNNYAGNAQAYGQTGLAGQMAAMDMFKQGAMGQGPSAAQALLQQQSQQAQRGNIAMMQGARGGNLAGAYQQALGANSGMQAGIAQSGAALRAQEQLAQQQAYAGMANQMAGQGLAYDQLNLQNALGQDQNALGWYTGQRGLDLQQRGQDRQFLGQIISAGIGAAGGLAQMVGSMGGGGGTESDVRAKEDMRPASMADAAAEVDGLAYRYKPGMGLPDGQQMGVGAQQLAQTSLGPTLVHQGPDGMLRVDGGRAGIAALAASGENARRLRAMEQQLAMSQGGSVAQQYGTREEGMRNTQLASRMSNDISAERGRANLARDRGAPANFGGTSQMTRFPAPPQERIYAISPFGPEPVDRPGLSSIAKSRSHHFPELG